VVVVCVIFKLLRDWFSPYYLTVVTLTFCLHVVTGGVFSKTEMSEVLTEVVRMDPTFDKEEFIKLCRFDIIPNVLEVVNYSGIA